MASAGDAWKRYSATGSWYYEVQDAGYKMNLCDILSALGRAQLKKCDGFWRDRSRIREKYDEAFRSMPELQLPPAREVDVHAWHLYILRIRPDLLELNRNRFIEELKKLGIGTSVHFIPLHLHPYYSRTYDYAEDQFPHANDAYSRCISLPIYPDMSEAEVERVITSVQAVVQGNRKSKSVGATR